MTGKVYGTLWSAQTQIANNLVNQYSNLANPQNIVEYFYLYKVTKFRELPINITRLLYVVE